MARRKKQKPIYDPRQQARRLARAVLGTPPAARVISSKKKSPPKHKKRELERVFED